MTKLRTAPRVTAIVVNYATADVTAECVRRIRAQQGVHVDVVVVDNLSGQAQRDDLRHALPDEEIVPTDRNLGFAGGLNAGFDQAWADRPDFLWVVTPDASADPSCLSALLDAMARDPRLGICGPLIEAGGELVLACDLIEWLGFLVRIRSTQPARLAGLPPLVPTDFVEGCSMLIRAETARQIGPFRLEFFLYYEECEYCLRARDHGWRLGVVPAARVRTRARRADRNARPYYMIRNSIVLARIRGRYRSAAVARGLVETAVRGLFRPSLWLTGLRALRDGLFLSLPEAQ